MEKMKSLLGIIRAPFLLLAPICVLLGAMAAYWEAGTLSPLYLFLAFVGAIAAHISVNALNEYFDFKSGLDDHTQRTPFSGGSGTLQRNPALATLASGIGWGAFALTLLIGVYFFYVRGIRIVPLGLIGLLVIGAYTPWLTKRPMLCLMAPGLGFGPLMVIGTYFVLTGSYSCTAFIVSLIPFFLVNNLLLMNQFPDIEADRRIGRRHLPLVLGPRKSCLVLGAFYLCAYLSIIAGVNLERLPKWSLLGLCTAVIAVMALRGALRDAENSKQLTPALAMNVMVNLITPVLVSIGLFLSA